MGVIALNSQKALRTLPQRSKPSNLGFDFGGGDEEEDVATSPM